MAIKNPAAASAILALMFASLLVIYVIVPQNEVVTILSVVIMAIGLVIAFVGDREEIMMMAGLAGLVSLVAAYFTGQSLFGNLGGVVATIAWGAALFFMARRASHETLVIPEDHAFMVAPFLSSQAYSLTSSIPVTSLPFLDRHVATIPTYELVTDVIVEKINIQGARDRGGVHDIDKIEVHTRYQVTAPDRTLRGIPNRGQIQSEVARELGTSVGSARQNVAFWEKLLARQMRAEVDDIVRKVIFDAPGISNLRIAYVERNMLSGMVQEKLQELVDRWGVTISEVSLNFFVLSKDELRMLKSQKEAFEEELKRTEARAANEADSERYRISVTGKAQAERIRAILEQVKELHPELRSEDVAEIVKADLLARGLDDESEIERALQGGKKS